MSFWNFLTLLSAWEAALLGCQTNNSAASIPSARQGSWTWVVTYNVRRPRPSLKALKTEKGERSAESTGLLADYEIIKLITSANCRVAKQRYV